MNFLSILVLLCQIIFVFGFLEGRGSLSLSPNRNTDDKTPTGSRHRHRHRTSSLLGLNGTQFQESTQPVATTDLTDALSIIEVYGVENGKKWILDPLQLQMAFTHPSICNSTKSASLKTQILAGLEKILNFYGSHLELILQDSNHAAGLSALKPVDDKYGKPFQNVFPISECINKICEASSEKSGEAAFCPKTSSQWKHRGAYPWKSVDVVSKLAVSNWELVGHEKDYLWGTLNAQCQHALVGRCEVPYICARTLYDPNPGSQYFLSHQLLQRIFTEQSDCPNAKAYLSEEINDQLCAKMYQEAILISQMGYPNILRDIFSEYVGFCGYMRYPNFFREDWIQTLLSWQTNSEYGCFGYDKDYESQFWTSDTPILRRPTSEEKQKGLVPDDQCLPHLTSVALSALTESWNFMEENCK